MQENFKACWSFTRQSEGGYSLSRLDPGNWSGGSVGAGRLLGSKFGISAPLLASWFGPVREATITSMSMQNLSESGAIAIYCARFWNVLRGHDLPSGIDCMAVDFGFNAGDGTSARILQRVLGLEPDGVVGPQTIGAAQKVPTAESLISRFQIAQAAYYEDLEEPRYLQGWLNRTAARAALARRLAAGMPTPPALQQPATA